MRQSVNHYRKPRPDCPHCEGSGRIVVETCSAAGEVFSTRYIRCICTDFVCVDSAKDAR